MWTNRLRHAALAAALVTTACIAPALAEPADAPRFRVETLDGETLVLDELLTSGPVLVDFWATWCKPCVKSLAEIQSLHERLADAGLRVVGVSIDGPRNYPKVRPFVARLGLSYPIVLDTEGDLQRDFRVTGVPTAVLIAPDGKIATVKQGYRPGETEALEAAILALIPEPTPADSSETSTDPEPGATER